MRPVVFPGEALQARREELGLSLKEVHNRIHVPMQHIVAMEAGDMAALPLPIYTTGFIASYCECLGLAPEPFLDRYRMLSDALAERPAAPEPRHAKAAPLSLPLPVLPAQRPAWMADAITWGAICGMLLLGWMTYAVVLQPAPESETRVNAGTFEIKAPDYHFFEDE